MNSESKSVLRKIVLAAAVIAAVPLVICGLFMLMFMWSMSDDHETIKTEYGDKFKVRRGYTFSEVDSDLYSTNSDMHIWVELGIYEDSFVGLAHTDDLTVYDVIGMVIFDDGNGFEELTSDSIDDKPEVAEIVKENVLSDKGSFNSYLHLLLYSKKYRKEAKKIIDLVNEWDTKRLAEYGLDETENYEDWKISYMVDANNILEDWKKQASYSEWKEIGIKS